MKLAIVNWPSCWGVAWPGMVAVTRPVWLIGELVAVAGTRIVGVTV